jgi:hypothetical protein
LKPARHRDPEQVRGRVIIVPFMNYLDFKADRRTSPIDGGNMNRSFPGKPDGILDSKPKPQPTTMLDTPDRDCFIFAEDEGVLELAEDLGDSVGKGDVVAFVHDANKTGAAPSIPPIAYPKRRPPTVNWLGQAVRNAALAAVDEGMIARDAAGIGGGQGGEIGLAIGVEILGAKRGRFEETFMRSPGALRAADPCLADTLGPTRKSPGIVGTKELRKPRPSPLPLRRRL